MDFTRKSRQRVQVKPESENLEHLYPHNVSLYKYPPTEDITIYQFEELALERLKLLRVFEQVSSKGLRFLSDEWKDSVTAELVREGLQGYVRLFSGPGSRDNESDLEARRRDHISHFILRLAYCRSSDLKRWFISKELEVFRFKFSALNASDIKQFLDINKLDYTPLTEDQKNEIKDGLYESTIGQSVQKIEHLDFYKVYFTEVLDLIKIRKCYLKNGYAYVNSHDFVSVIANIYQIEIEKGLQAVQKFLPDIENDERLFYLLKGLHTSYTGKDYTCSKGDGIPIESIDQLSKKSFPLCMRMCHDTLRAKHHLKHTGRIQYGLFLKGIGVTLEDSLRFWREEFTRIMDLEKFEKSYSYNIRHNYGKEGSMINYTPHSCMKIITTTVGPQEIHGCPFKIWDLSRLKAKLSEYGLSTAHAIDVCSYSSKGHYQIACSKYFEVTHETVLEQGINHPNQYFEVSQAIMEKRNPKGSNSGAIPKNVVKKEKRTIMDPGDDDELWQTAETQEKSVSQITPHENTKAKNEWEDGFDMSSLENMY